MKKIAIVGAGGFGREVKMLIEDINENNNQFEIIGFYDDKKYETEINGLPYLGEIERITEVDYPLCITVAIGDPKTKKKIIEGITNENIEFPSLIHPSVIIGRDNVKIGNGNIICAGVIITVDIEIENFVILNLSCTVGHDTKIKDYSSFIRGVTIK